MSASGRRPRPRAAPLAWSVPSPSRREPPAPRRDGDVARRNDTAALRTAPRPRAVPSGVEPLRPAYADPSGAHSAGEDDLRHSVEVVAEDLGAARVTQLGHRLRLDLPD